MAKKERLNARADRVMGRAQKNWRKGQDALKYDETASPDTSNAVGYANRKLNQAARQEDRAKALKAKATSMKKGGSITAKKKK
jgi:hypothetical protein